jgi:heme exporter protein D
MSTVQTFFAMGGYAIYVWPAYAVFFLVLLADTLAPRLRRRRLLRDLRARLVRQQARQAQTRQNHARPQQADHPSLPQPPSA